MLEKHRYNSSVLYKSLSIKTNNHQNSVVAVIVTHNRLEKLKTACSKILPQAVEAVIVVDNASDDGTGKWLSSQPDKKLHVIHSVENLGGAGGFWLGFKTALEVKPNAQWILCFDDDAYPQEDLIHNFRSQIWDASIGGVASAVYLPDGQIAEMNRPILNPFGSLRRILKSMIRGREEYHIGQKEYQTGETIPIDAMSFVGAFIRTSLVRGKLGLPRKEFFIYSDDTIYTLKIKKIGYQNIFWPGLEFAHDCKSVETGKKKYVPTWKVYYTLRNGVQLYRELAGPYYFFPLAFKLMQLLRSTFYYEKKKRFLAYLFWGLNDGLKSRFNVHHETVISFLK